MHVGFHHSRKCEKTYGSAERGETIYVPLLRENIKDHFMDFFEMKILEYSAKYCNQIIKGKLKLASHITAAHPGVNGELCEFVAKFLY